MSAEVSIDFALILREWRPGGSEQMTGRGAWARFLAFFCANVDARPLRHPGSPSARAHAHTILSVLHQVYACLDYFSERFLKPCSVCRRIVAYCTKFPLTT